MHYVDGAVSPVPVENKELFIQQTKIMGEVFKEHGALSVVDCWGVDVPKGKKTDMLRAVDLKEGENVVFSWVIWPSKEARDAAMPKVMADPRLANEEKPAFDYARLIWGSFEMINNM